MSGTASSSRAILRASITSPRSALSACRRCLASDAYFPPSPATTTTSPQVGPSHPSLSPSRSLNSDGKLRASIPPSDNPATSESPANLTAEQKELISRIIRVDQAGEVGANWIYRGQKWAMGLRGDKKSERQIEDMWTTERHHLATMDLLRRQHDVRPTALYPLWQAMAFGLGASTGLMGREAAMACTEAVETVIGEHYDDQLRALRPLLETSKSAGSSPHPSLPLLRDVLKEFRDDELEHLDTAVEGGAQKAPGHSLLSAVIGLGCKAAIKVCERI